MKTILLINAEGVQTICLARSLRNHGCKVVGFCNHRCSSGYVTKYLNERHKSPDISAKQEDFKQYLYSYLSNQNVDLIVPLADDGAAFLSSHKEEIEKEFGTRCAIAAEPVFTDASNKQSFMALCEKMSIQHPRTFEIDEDSVETAVNHVGFPALIKPNHSQGAKGIVKVENISEVKEKLPSILSQFGSCTLQQYIEQPGYYYNVMLYRDKSGEITAETVIKIRRFFPLKGGSSCYCETVCHEKLVRECSGLLDSIGWRGIADIDVLEDKLTGDLHVIELNPRAPSSFQAAFAAGIDFGECLLADYYGTELSSFNYREGQQIRWMGLDTMWFLFSRDRFRFRPSWFRFFGRNVSYQDGSWSDPLPMIAGIMAGVLKYLNPSFRRAKMKE